MSPYRALSISALAAAFATLSLAIPIYVIRPFRPQDPHALALALTVRNAAPLVSGVCAVVAVILLMRFWPHVAGIALRSGLMLCAIVAISAGCLTHVDIFQQMFHPYADPHFAAADAAPIDPDDKLLSISIAGSNHAFPIRTMGYHHIVNDTLAGIPIAATYCTLCHTGVVYDRRLDGRTLYFTLAGINNGNALLRDRETGSIWQQSTGEAIFGPLKGRRLTLVPSDELTFAVWRSEQAGGLILKPDAPNLASYDPKDWEAHIAKTHVVLDTSSTGIDPHTIMLGVALGSDAKAFPLQSILAARLVEDHLPGHPIVIVVGPDDASVRVFSPQLPSRPMLLNFLLAPSSAGQIVDRETSSTWNFAGCATAGPLAGQCLTQVEAHKDYWFDWQNHHPDTTVRRD